MGTHARIGVVIDNKIKSIYCNNDGYGIGDTLKNYYSTFDLAKQLVDLGDISSLGETIGKKVDFNTYNSVEEMYKRDQSGEPWQTVAYHRDRKEPLRYEIHDTLQEFTDLDYRYKYLFDNGKWHYYNVVTDRFDII